MTIILFGKELFLRTTVCLVWAFVSCECASFPFGPKGGTWDLIVLVPDRAGRTTTEQIFSLRILCEKYLQHQQKLYHVFIDFKKAFDIVWQTALWATMRKYNISANLVHTIEQIYDKATIAVQMNGSIRE